MLASMFLHVRSLRDDLKRSLNGFGQFRAFPPFLSDVRRRGAISCRSVWMDLPQLQDRGCLRQAMMGGTRRSLRMKDPW